ncbi:hypothetical protein ACFV4K_06545 [Nocardia sp. NPDC059764]|uniref:hypothetical protein n=1 Tax=Nocardia sp. NPDC059764 TaxID=3346939 RepID=UPI003648E036
MSDNPPLWFVDRFTVPRLAPYLRTALREDVPVVDLYVWNLQLSEAFYVPLHCLEVCLRNSIHHQLKTRFSQEDWWAVAPLRPDHRTRIENAAADVRQRKLCPSADDVVAELSFGLWVSLLSRAYDRHLWVPALHNAFPHYRGPREQLRRDLDTMRLFRNRIMHHEPIHHRGLAADHAKIYALLDCLGPEIKPWLRTVDRVPSVLALRPQADQHA